MRVKLCEFDVVLLHAKKNKNQMSEIPEFNQEVANGRPRNTIFTVCVKRNKVANLLEYYICFNSPIGRGAELKPPIV